MVLVSLKTLRSRGDSVGTSFYHMETQKLNHVTLQKVSSDANAFAFWSCLHFCWLVMTLIEKKARDTFSTTRLRKSYNNMHANHGRFRVRTFPNVLTKKSFCILLPFLQAAFTTHQPIPKSKPSFFGLRSNTGEIFHFMKKNEILEHKEHKQ